MGLFVQRASVSFLFCVVAYVPARPWLVEQQPSLSPMTARLWTPPGTRKQERVEQAREPRPRRQRFRAMIESTPDARARFRQPEQ